MQHTNKGKPVTIGTHLPVAVRNESHVQDKRLMDQLLAEFVGVFLAKAGRVHAVSNSQVGHATSLMTKHLRQGLDGVV